MNRLVGFEGNENAGELVKVESETIFNGREPTIGIRKTRSERKLGNG